MKLSLFCYSRRGAATADRLLSLLREEDCTAYAPERFAGESGLTPIPKPSAAFYGERFSESDAMIFVGSCGIAVREIAPFVRDKKHDPAVLCIDELGTYVIPLLSGHIGGANALAGRLAKELGALPVVTTATDLNGKFSVDAWAQTQGFRISDMGLAKAVSSAILEQDVPLLSDFPVCSEYPAGTFPAERGPLGIYVTCSTAKPFDKTLRLIPRVLHLGIGCRKDTPLSAIAEAVAQVLEQNGLDRRALKCAASIDLKAQEPGLLEYCRSAELPVCFYSAEQLSRVEGDFTPSDFVRSITGVDNVCERSALLGADRLIVKKTAVNGVTVAIAAEHLEVHFE